MARARNIKPALFKNEVLGVADPMLTLLFEGLWLLADRSGRLEDRPLRIKGELFPYREGLNMDGMLDWLASNGFIIRYQADGKRYIEIDNFVKHQNPHKNEPESEIPAPSDTCTPPDKIGTSTEKFGIAPADLLIPDSLSLDLLIPDSPIPEEEPLPVAKAPAALGASNVKVLKPKSEKPKTDQQLANAATWNAYSNAYFDRYGADPVRNAKVNGQVAQLVARLGAEEAPHVAAFYVSINDSFFIRSSHEFGLLVARAEGIRTQWVTGRQVNSVTARQMENAQANATAAQDAGRLIDGEGERNAFL